MMKRIFLIAAFSLIAVNAYSQQAQPSLTDQLGAMRQAQDQNDEAASQAQRAYEQQMARQRAAAQAQAEREKLPR
jgi:hypothetical protein